MLPTPKPNPAPKPAPTTATVPPQSNGGSGKAGARLRGAGGLLLAIALVAIVLRAPVTAAAPLLERIRDDLGLSGAAVGVLTSLPVLCLGVFAFAAPPLGRRYGEARVVVTSLIVLVVGATLRVVPSATALFVGTTLIGAAIGLANVLLPSLIKRHFAGAITSVTVFYSACLTLGGAGGSAAAAPLGTLTDSAWLIPLALLAIPPALLALAAWLPHIRSADTAIAARPRAARVSLWRDTTAWQVTAFFGGQALLAYAVFGWLPTIGQDRGMSDASSGLLLSLTSLVGVAGAMVLPAVYRRLPDQRIPAVTVAVLSGVGLAGVVLAPMPAGVWAAAVLLGLGQGAGFAVALSLIGLRTRNPHEASALSAMAQGIGYLIGTVGPLGAGLLHEATGGWGAPLAALLAVCAVQIPTALAAGRPRHVTAE